MAETGVILTPDQRVRVFISSTLGELAEERAAARRAIRRLHLVPVWYESGARPHPPRSMYRAYLDCAHYLSVAETAAPHLTGPEQGEWLARLDADQANLRRAAEHAAHNPDGTTQVLRFGAALRRYWMTRFRNEEALALLMPVLDRPEAQADPQVFAAALVTAITAARYANIGTALRLGEQAVKLARQLDNDRLLIESLAALSAAWYYAGKPKRGLPPGREAVERARRLGDDVLLGRSLADFLLCDALIDPAHARRGMAVQPARSPCLAPSSLDAAGCIACQQVTHLGQGDQIEVTWDGVLERGGRYREVQRLVLPHPRGQTVNAQPQTSRRPPPCPQCGSGRIWC